MISKFRTRKLAVTILAIFIISAFTPVMSLFVKGTANTKFPLEVVVDNGDSTSDTLRLADHTSNADGNWIELIGTDGDVITLPDPITVDVTSTVDSKQFTYEGKTVNIDTEFTWPKEVTYPLTSHKVYHSGDVVEIEFTSSVAYTGDTVELRLIQGTLNGIRNVVTEALNGNIVPLKDYLHNNEIDIGGPLETTLSGGNVFSFTKNFGALNVGEYVAVVLVETDDGTDYVLDLYSFTPIEVLDYDLTVSPSYNDIQENLEVEATVESATGSSYSYGAFLVNQDIYSLYADVNTDGTLSGTTVDVGVDSGSNLYRVVENQQFLGVSLSDYSTMLSQSFWQDVIVDLETDSIISAGDMAFTADIESSLSSLIGLDALVLDVSGFQGTYWLMTIVYEHGEGKIAAFDQQEVQLGQAAITSLTSDDPKKFTEIVTLSYTVNSPEAMTGVKAKVRILDGLTPIYVGTLSEAFDLVSGDNALTYEWDPLRTIAVSGNTNGKTLDVEFTLVDSTEVLIDDELVSVELTKSIRTDAWSRVVGVVANWGLYTSTERPVIWSEIVVKVVANWGLFSAS